MSLTQEQRDKIKQILTSYAKDVNEILNNYEQDVVTAIQAADKRKTDEIHRLIAESK